MRQLGTSRIALLLLAVATVVGMIGVAGADELVQTEPHADELVDHTPESIVLTFDEPLLLEPGVQSAVIMDADGVRLDDGGAAIATYSDRVLVVKPAPGVELEGAVRVFYVVTFASGADLTGEVEFEIEPGVTLPAVEPPAGEGRSSESIVLWTVAILGGVALFALLAFYLRVATDNAQSSLEEPSESH